MTRTIRPAALAALFLASAILAAEEPAAPPAPGDLILIDHFGHVVSVPAEKVPRGLLPPPEVGLTQ